MKLGILREGKIPHDDRVALTPAQCRILMGDPHNFSIVVQPSPTRCFKDEEYIAAGIPVQEGLDDCNIILGVKEVPIKDLMQDKTYFSFRIPSKSNLITENYFRQFLKKELP